VPDCVHVTAGRAPLHDRSGGTPVAVPRCRRAASSLRRGPAAHKAARHAGLAPEQAQPPARAPASGAAMRTGLGHYLGRRRKCRGSAAAWAADAAGLELAGVIRARARGHMAGPLLEDPDLVDWADGRPFVWVDDELGLRQKSKTCTASSRSWASRGSIPDGRSCSQDQKRHLARRKSSFPMRSRT